MAELAFKDGVMEQIRLREPRFHEHAFLFVLAALEQCQQRLGERRHITGKELAETCRDLAIERYGVMSRLVLDHWGIRESVHFGDIVFALVDLGMLIKQPHDQRDDFANAFDFRVAFDSAYPWRNVPQG